MLTYLAQYLAEFYSGFNVFQYITLRAILGVLTALFIALLVGPAMIRRLSHLQIGQTVREDGPESHFSKAGTPTMGGLLIIVSICVSTLLWSDLSNRFVWVALLTTLYGAMLANMVALPISDKVALRKDEEGRIKAMIIDAIMGIQAGQNPRVIDSMLRNYLPASKRAAEEKAE